MRKVLLLSATLALALGSVAYAADGGGGGGGGRGGAAANPACAADMAKYCKDQQGQAAGACLRTNVDKLADACKAVVNAGGGGRGGGGGGGG